MCLNVFYLVVCPKQHKTPNGLIPLNRHWIEFRTDFPKTTRSSSIYNISLNKTLSSQLFSYIKYCLIQCKTFLDRFKKTIVILSC